MIQILKFFCREQWNISLSFHGNQFLGGGEIFKIYLQQSNKALSYPGWEQQKQVWVV